MRHCPPASSNYRKSIISHHPWGLHDSFSSLEIKSRVTPKSRNGTRRSWSQQEKSFWGLPANTSSLFRDIAHLALAVLTLTKIRVSFLKNIRTEGEEVGQTLRSQYPAHLHLLNNNERIKDPPSLTSLSKNESVSATGILTSNRMPWNSLFACIFFFF